MMKTKYLWNLLKTKESKKQFKSQSTEFGVRDTLNAYFIEQVLKLHKDETKTDEEISQFCKLCEGEHGDSIFNPFLQLKGMCSFPFEKTHKLIIFCSGFHGHLDTPFESLHVILLGILKYIYRDTLSKLSPQAYSSVRGRFRSFDTAGLNIPPIQPDTMVRFARSLVGKEF